MIAGLSFDYAHARLAARIGRRPDERLWAQVHAARSVPALLEIVRAGAAASLVSGVSWPSTSDEAEAALRQVLRAQIREVAGWAPEAWQPAVLWTLHLVDLPALVHLLSDAPVPAWMTQDPQLAAWAESTPKRRRTALESSPLSPIVAAIADSGAARPREALHPALRGWRLAWRNRWPGAGADTIAALERLERLVTLHIGRFAGVAADEAAAARSQLDRAITTLWRQHPAEPVGPFAALALFALDIERIRGELAPRIAGTGGEPIVH